MKKWLFLLRAFFPSWKFFDDVGPELRLEGRWGTSEENLCDWANCLPPIRRSVKNLVINPHGNYLHACHNLLNHLSSDIAECDLTIPDDLMKRPTYLLTRNLVRYQLTHLHSLHGEFSYQFRLSANYIGRFNKPTDYLLVSPIYQG